MTRYCKTDSFSCDSLGTKGLRKTIEDMKKGVAALKAKKAPAADIAALEKKLAEQEKKLESDLKEIEVRITQGTGCVSSRKAVQTLFKNVKDEVKREGDKALETYVDALVKKYEAEEEGHDIARENAEKAVDNCEAAKAGHL